MSHCKDYFASLKAADPLGTELEDALFCTNGVMMG